MSSTNKYVFSIITVTYNAVDTLAATIESVVRQTFSNYEYIVIDGGSVDGTLDIIKKHEKNVTLWVSEPDSGIFDAMNKGLKFARGRFVYFLNSGDCLVDSDVLLNVNKMRLSNSAIFCGQVLVTKNFTHKEVIDVYPTYRTNSENFRGLFGSSFCHQALFIPRQAYIDVGGFDTSFKFFSDFYTVGKIITNRAIIEYHDINIAYFNVEGVSSDWRKVRLLENEKEQILGLLGNKRNVLFRLLKNIRTELFILKKRMQHARFNR